MARTKKATGGEGGNHLTIRRYDDGTVDMKWNWDKLLEEVREAIATVSTNLVEVTETKIKKTRAKKVNKDNK